jgi:hypothetical protein
MSTARPCYVCKRFVAKGAACLADDRVTFRDPEGFDNARIKYAHLACAIHTRHEKVRTALRKVNPELLVELLVEVERLDPELAAEVAHRLPRTRRSAPLTDEQARELLVELEASPEDTALLTVLGDHLLQRGDERGELITLQLAGSEEARRDELLATLLPKLEPADRHVWGIGFLRDLVLNLEAQTFATRGPVLAHPSCALLSKVTIHQIWQTWPSTELARGSLPKSVRALTVTGGLRAGDLSWLPHLATLATDICDDVAHPTVAELHIRAHRETIEACARGLPNVERLKITPTAAEPLPELSELLDATGWFTRLREIELSGITADELLHARVRRHKIRLIETK